MLDVSVLDKERRPVWGLTASDFTILEDGKPQDVRMFKAVDLDDVVDLSVAPWTRQVAPDIRTNDDFGERRVVVIVMDDATPMPMQEVPRAKAITRQVIDALGPKDLACVVFALNKRLGQEFTEDKARLLESVDRFNGAIDGAGTDEHGKWWLRMPFDTFNLDSTSLYLGTLRLIRSVAEDLATLPDRRKALVFVSVGIPMGAAAPDVSTGPSGNVGGAEAVRDVWRSVQASLEAARRANVTIYGLDPGGLRGPGVYVAGGLRGRGGYDLSGLQPTGGVSTADSTGLHPGLANQEFLKTVSENTGGFAITDTNAPAPQIQQLLRENASYYLLGYAPSDTRAQGRYRRIDVKVNRPGVTVRSRNGYFEPASGEPKRTSTPAPSAEVAALQGIVPKGDIALRVHAVPFATGGGAESDVAVILQGREPIPVGSTATAENLTVLVHAYNPQAELKASERLTARLAIRQGAVNDLRFGLLSRLSLKPGRYHLRLAASSSMSGKSGSVYAEIDVPDFSKPKLSLSGVMFEVAPSPLTAPKGKLASLIPIVPTAERDFVAGDTVTAFARIYQGAKAELVPVAATTRIVDGTGDEVFSKMETVAADRFAAGRSADLLVSVPIATLAPGPHLLTVTVSHGAASARQQVRFNLHGSGGRTSLAPFRAR